MKVTEVSAPSSTLTIVQDVEQFLDQHNLRGTTLFEHYDNALRAVWPNLHIADPKAQILTAINVYLEVAEKRGFEVKPNFLKQAAKDDLL